MFAIAVLRVSAYAIKGGARQAWITPAEPSCCGWSAKLRARLDGKQSEEIVLLPADRMFIDSWISV